MFVRTLLAAALLAATSYTQDLHWPGFRGPNRDGVARGAKPLTKWSDDEGVRWKVELPGAGSSSPIVVGDRVYVACYSGFGHYAEDGGEMKDLKHHLVCVDRSNGKIVWDRVIPGPIEKRPPRVQITEHGFASPTPVCDGKAIYAYFGRAGVMAVSLAGDVLWKKDLGWPSKDAPAATNSVSRGGRQIPLRWGSAASPLLFDDLVIVNSSEENNAIQAFDKHTGKVVWKRESANLEGTAISPTMAGPADSRYVLMVLGGEIWALEPKTGKLLWSVETDTRGGMSSMALSDQDLIYVFGGEGDNYTLHVDPKDEKSRVAWRSKNVEIPSPILRDGKLFLVNMQGQAHCMSARDGKVLFTGRLEGRTSQVYASPVLANGHLYVVSRKRGVFVYECNEKLKLVSRNQLTDETQFNASPAIVGTELYLRSDKHLYCIAGK